MEYIDQDRDEFGVEPICTRADRRRRADRPEHLLRRQDPAALGPLGPDAATTGQIRAGAQDNFGVYGARKVAAELRPARSRPWPAARSQRLMRAAGLRGITPGEGRGPRSRGTGPDTRRTWSHATSPPPAPNRLWVADITYVPHVVRLGLCRVRPRRVLPARRRLADLRPACAPTWPWTPSRWACGPRHRAGRDITGLIHHSDAGVQYLAVRYAQRLAEAGAVASVGSIGDSYDNAMAEALNSLFKAELVRNKGPWTGIDDLEIAVAEYIDWFNTAACTARSASSRRPSTRTTTTVTTSPRPPSARQFRASTEPGAGQRAAHRQPVTEHDQQPHRAALRVSRRPDHHSENLAAPGNAIWSPVPSQLSLAWVTLFSANSRKAAGTSILGTSNFGSSKRGISNFGISVAKLAALAFGLGGDVRHDGDPLSGVSWCRLELSLRRFRSSWRLAVSGPHVRRSREISWAGRHLLVPCGTVLLTI